MSKKILAIMLIVLVSVCSVFAVNMKVGIHAGYGAADYKFTGAEKVDETNVELTMDFKNQGFYAVGTFAFEVIDNLDIQVEAGINTMGKAKASVGLFSGATVKDSKNAPISIVAFLGAIYNIPVIDKLSIGVGGGVDFFYGGLFAADGSLATNLKASEIEDANKNISFGVGAEMNVSYEITKNISVLLGGKFDWHFLNKNGVTENAKKEKEDLVANILTYKIFAGATYSF